MIQRRPPREKTRTGRGSGGGGGSKKGEYHPRKKPASTLLSFILRTMTKHSAFIVIVVVVSLVIFVISEIHSSSTRTRTSNSSSSNVHTMNEGQVINVVANAVGAGAAASSLSASPSSSIASTADENIKILTRENFIPTPLDHALYQQEYDTYQATKKDATVDVDVSSSHEDGDAASIDMKTYGKHILENGCDLTVVFMDPRIHSMKKGSSMFFSLESVGAFLPEACVILQTSSCSFHKEDADSSSSLTVEDAIYQRIYNNSLPLFRKMIERGQVRVTFLQHKKYNFKECDQYPNPSSALMNIHYWSDIDEKGENGEYIAGVDNDSVLVMQNDSVICHPINIDLYRKYAYVGGVWLREHPFIQNTNMCRFLKQMWTQYTRLRLGPFPDICTGDGTAPIGNGGFTLRSRSALRKAIRDCPNRDWSGLDIDKSTLRRSKCSVNGSINEDVYFGTILRGTNALLPTALEAALFSVEMVWPEEVIDMYHGGSVGSLEETQRFVSERGSIYRGATIDTSDIKAAKELTRDETVPFGFHKSWWYFDNKVLHSKDVDQQCPLLKYMFHPDENRAKDLIVNKKPKSGGGVKGAISNFTHKLPKKIGRHLLPR